MERSKGKIECGHVRPWEIWIGADTHIADVHGTQDVRRANAAHFVKCWNAFEDRGLVGEMRDAIRSAYLDLVKGNIEDTQAGKILKAVLERRIDND